MRVWRLVTVHALSFWPWAMWRHLTENMGIPVPCLRKAEQQPPLHVAHSEAITDCAGNFSFVTYPKFILCLL